MFEITASADTEDGSQGLVRIEVRHSRDATPVVGILTAGETGAIAAHLAATARDARALEVASQWAHIPADPK